MYSYSYGKEEGVKTSVLALALIAVLAAGILIGLNMTGQLPAGSEVIDAPLGDIPQLSTDGFDEVSVSVEPAVIHLASGCSRLDMATNELQTYYIEMGLNKARDVRPLTHDLVQDIVETFEIKPLMVKIESFSEGVYFAKLLLRHGNRILNMDSKPSDAIAIAVRIGAPVYVNRTLMEEYGEKFC
jgi:bifunctional DNase/RNase